MDDADSCMRHAESRAVRYIGSRYQTCPGYMGPEHQTGVILTPPNIMESRLPVTVAA
jgi:hypothetical protein